MTGGQSAILTYHSLDDSGSVISLSPDLFRRQMEFLAASRIPVVPLQQALCSAGSVAITFDDGYRNLLDHAIPVLEQHRFPATVFVVTAYCGRSSNWPSLHQEKAPELPLLNWDRLASLPESVSVGAHTIHHPDLSRLTPAQCEGELRDSRQEIEQRLGRACPWLAYPYGASSPKVRALANSHFDLAVGTSLRFVSHAADRMDLPRIDAYYLRGAFSLEKLFTATGSLFLGVRRGLREIRQFASNRVN